MFVKLAGFKEMINRSYQHENLHVMNTGGDYVLYGSGWYLCVDITRMSKKAKAAVIELIGEWPESGEAFQAGKKSGNQMEMIEDERYWLASNVTKEAAVQMEETPIVLNGNIRLMRQQGSNELIPVLEHILDVVNAKHCDSGEEPPKGPFLYKHMTWWKNNDMFFAYGNVSLGEDTTEELLRQRLKDVI